MKIMVCNAGSTSLKFKLYDMPACNVLSTGKVERVGSSDDAIFSYVNCVNGFRLDLDRQCIHKSVSPCFLYENLSFGGETTLD